LRWSEIENHNFYFSLYDCLLLLYGLNVFQTLEQGEFASTIHVYYIISLLRHPMLILHMRSEFLFQNFLTVFWEVLTVESSENLILFVDAWKLSWIFRERLSMHVTWMKVTGMTHRYPI